MKEIKTLDDLVQAINKSFEQLGAASPWWRGEPKVYLRLLPKAHRRGLSAEFEMNLYHRFEQRARTRYPNCPDSNDQSAWLFLMQHYRLPTRLLDWTESILVATYFAVNKHPDETAVLWALNPFRLNQDQIEKELIPAPNDGSVIQLFRSVRIGDEPEDKVAAVLAAEHDIRMLVQLSAFTIHGNRTPLNELANKEQFIMKFEIPPEAKNNLRVALEFFGFNRSYLFPDLENLAKDLESKLP